MASPSGPLLMLSASVKHLVGAILAGPESAADLSVGMVSPAVPNGLAGSLLPRREANRRTHAIKATSSKKAPTTSPDLSLSELSRCSGSLVSFLNIWDPHEPVHSLRNSPGRRVRYPSVTGESEFPWI
jgi:hypothetical protein